MAAILPVDVFRQMTLPAENVAHMIGVMSGHARPMARPTASWHLGVDGRPVCTWTIATPEIRGIPPS
ncbi:MAG: hypothetical protein M3N26_05285 [Pseudomonadota bacterium]|nr:hypothetical protein [Pseudomonadota bacterium]